VAVTDEAPTGSGTVIRVARTSGTAPPRHPEVHVIGDADGPGGLAAAFSAAAEVAARI